MIGIVTQTLEDGMHSDPDFDGYNSYIMEAYVQFMQSAGARVVPLILNDTQEVNLAKLQKLNGVLLPGGDGDYFELGRFIYEKVKEINDNGTYLPLWGTCAGYENMVAY